MKKLYLTITLFGALGFATLGVAHESGSKHNHREHKGLPGGHSSVDSTESEGTYQGTHDHRKRKGLPGKGIPTDQAASESMKSSSEEPDGVSAGSTGSIKHDHRKQKGLACSSLPDEGEVVERSGDLSSKKAHDHKKMHK